jgi:hypothetical protein
MAWAFILALMLACASMTPLLFTVFQVRTYSHLACCPNSSQSYLDALVHHTQYHADMQYIVPSPFSCTKPMQQ